MLKIVLLLFLHYLNLMVETIGEAFSLGWRLKARCAYGKREGLKSIRECTWTYDLDMLTLVTTRGRDFPLAILASRLRCPRCGSRSGGRRPKTGSRLTCQCQRINCGV